MSRAFIALGSNLGDRALHLAQAVRGLCRSSTVVRVSSLYETEPVGGPDQGPYLNAVAELQTDFAPFRLLQVLAGLEQEAGRLRTVRFGPRTLDLDLLWWDGEEVRSDVLTLPHPRAHERRFVLEPWVEIWAEGSIRGRALSDWLREALPAEVHRLQGPEWVRAVDS